MKIGQKISCVYNGKGYAGTIENMLPPSRTTLGKRIMVVALDGGGYRSLYEHKMEMVSVG
jgi:hypothetical protein